jgi:uncharacterized protein YdeI (YjbR/CyaY-like superfamily)
MVRKLGITREGTMTKERADSTTKRPEPPETLSFATPREWERWLSKNQDRTEGIWLRFFKKASGVPSVTYDEALDGALCYGWIDGQLKPGDARSYLRKFTPRRAKSPWSKRNIDHVRRLTKAGRMKPAGLTEVRAARADGRWESAYDPGSTMTIPADFLERLSTNRKAKEFFSTLNKANTYAIGWRLQTAKKPETRERRLTQILALLARGEKLHG